ncbi:MAG: GGDEF domain-containing protein [Vallitalea sp.]|nr:GGDEF domain-containing protein [Vallitalea sp.]
MSTKKMVYSKHLLASNEYWGNMMQDNYYNEEKLLFDNEVKVNYGIAKVLFYIAITVIPLVIVLQLLGVFIYYMVDAIMAIVTAFILLIMPRILTIVHVHKKKWFKYILLILVVMILPLIYLEYDYMVLILWIFPLLISCMYFSNKFNTITVIFDVVVLGFTSYYRSYQRLQNNLISKRIGGLFKDFIISYITYAMLVIISYVIIFLLTKKTNELLQDAIKKKEFEILSITDSMTGMYNHRYLMSELEKNQEQFHNENIPFAAVLFDVDHFKSINDTYGHVEGDCALQAIVKCLQKIVRQDDVIGRYGGEEFLVILSNTTVNEAYMIAEKCRQAVSRLKIENIDRYITISGGVAEYNGEDIRDYIRSMDEKMYDAKNNGRNIIIA